MYHTIYENVHHYIFGSQPFKKLSYASLSRYNDLLLDTKTCLSLRLLGLDKLFSYAINEWLNDIKKNQLPGILGGVGPIHSLVQLGEYSTL